jgi:hypothetical protein
MGTGGSFPGGKAWPGRDADHSPPSSVEVKYEEELYLLSPHLPPWHVAGQLYFTFTQHFYCKTAYILEIYILYNKTISILTFTSIHMFPYVPVHYSTNEYATDGVSPLIMADRS